ncbi:MAG TPA: DUF2062 domain-containing protein [Tepidisphaeraceae bacterium]
MEDLTFRPVVIAPTFNNARTLAPIVSRIRASGYPLIVVNDGSSDDTARMLIEMDRDAPTPLIVLNHRKNRGKGTALRTGFAAARLAGYTHAVTIDTDDQHDPSEIPRLLDAARRSPHALVLGRRDHRADGYPARSRIGRGISNLFVRLESGVRVDDSQCGFRVYPLGLLMTVRCGNGYYGFETEIITRAGWAGCPVVQVPVACRYLPGPRRVSHFQPFRDSARGVLMHFHLLGRALLPFVRHPRWPDVASAQPLIIGPKKPLLRRFLDWINPRQAWRQLRQNQLGRSEIAAGLALGVFIANLPAYGFQSLLSLYAARRLHLHPLSVLLGSHASTPPVGPLLIAAAIALGHVLLHGSLPALADFDPRHVGWSHVVGPLLLEWMIGGILLGLVLAMLTFVVAVGLLRFVADREPAADPATAPS